MPSVGPRPERPEFVRIPETTIPFQARRVLIKPGITGWAQLRGDYASDSESAADRLSYDLRYLRHRNLTVDLAICAKTRSALLCHAGRLGVRTPTSEECTLRPIAGTPQPDPQ